VLSDVNTPTGPRIGACGFEGTFGLIVDIEGYFIFADLCPEVVPIAWYHGEVTFSPFGTVAETKETCISTNFINLKLVNGWAIVGSYNE
jgi:hypothetical protein